MLSLALATAKMNFLTQLYGLSAREVWAQRDWGAITCNTCPVLLNQHFLSQQKHVPSAKTKACGGNNASTAVVFIADLVFLKGDKDKLPVPHPVPDPTPAEKPRTCGLCSTTLRASVFLCYTFRARYCHAS